MAHSDARVAPDGYQYGVRFNDGGVLARWNGRTQRERVEEAAARWAKIYYPDNIVPVRHRLKEPWETY